MFTKRELLSIPNILCYIRILLVPVFIYTYFYTSDENGHMLSAGILILSSLSDFFDGFIARRFHMITNFGKLIDPVADKLTQFVVAFALMYTYPAYTLLVILIILKDGMLLFFGYYVYKKTGRHLEQAQMPGKIATAVFFVVSIVLIALYIPHTVMSMIMIYATAILMFIAMLYYGNGLYKLYRTSGM